MTDLIFANTVYTREVFDVIYERSQHYQLPGDLLCGLGIGESDLNEYEQSGDNGDSVGGYQVNRVHGNGWPDRYLGIEGVRNSIDLMAEQWTRMFEGCGGWIAWVGRSVIPEEHALPAIVVDPRSPRLDPRALRHGRAAFLYHWWPRAQTSWRPLWDTAVKVETWATALWLYYLDSVRLKSLPSDMSPEWLLRVGIAQALLGGVDTCLNGALSRDNAAAGVRNTAENVIMLLDRLGSPVL